MEKPYFQFVNLSKTVIHLIFTLLNNKMVTAIFKTSIFIDNIFIYCCLIFNNIKQ